LGLFEVSSFVIFLICFLIATDLKPENILLQADGHIRMADFGLSKQADEIPQATLIRRKIKKHFFSVLTSFYLPPFSV